MADDMAMPAGFGGLMRYKEEYNSKFKFGPGTVVAMIIVVLLVPVRVFTMTFFSAIRAKKVRVILSRQRQELGRVGSEGILAMLGTEAVDHAFPFQGAYRRIGGYGHTANGVFQHFVLAHRKNLTIENQTSTARRPGLKVSILHPRCVIP